MWTWGWLPSSWKAAYQRKSSGGIFIAALLILSILILAVDPADFSKPFDGPVLYDKAEGGDTGANGPDDAAGADDDGTAPGSASPSAS